METIAEPHGLMKILAVCHYYPPHVGGLEIAAQNTACSLSKAGHEVTILTCAHQKKAATKDDEEGVCVHRVRSLNFFDTHFGIPFPIPFGLFSLMWRAVRVADIVHIHDVLYIPSWMAFVCAVLLHKPLLLTQHVARVEHSSRLVMLVQNAVNSVWGVSIFKYSTRIIVYNAIVKEFVSSRTQPKKVIEIRNGIDRTLFHPPVNEEEKKALRKYFNLPDRPLVLFVGRFVPKKGIDALFAARDAAYDLVFAGSGEIKKEWKDARGVYVIGALRQEELAKLYRTADVCVLPSRGELFTLTLQEAAASGLPLVTTNESAYASYDIDREEIALVDPTPSILRTTIKRILSDEKRHTRMAHYSIALAEKWFDREKNSASLVRIFTEFDANRRIVTTSWDDGHVLDVRLAALLKKYGVCGTFYISPENHELADEDRLHQEQLAGLSGFEIGAHTVTHPYLPEVDNKAARKEILSSKEILEKWTGREVTSFCYPKGGYSNELENIVSDAKFKRARTTERFALDIGDNPFAMPTSIHTYDHASDIWNLARFVRFNPIQFVRLYRRWDRQAMALFDRMLKDGGVFHLWGHSWEVDRNRDWERLEKVLAYISKREGVKYVTNDAL